MFQDTTDSNKAVISGVVSKAPVFSHEYKGENFYMMYANVMRLSQSFDTIPVLVSDRLCNIEELTEGKYIYVSGQFRSYNTFDGNKSKLILLVFARDIYTSESLPVMIDEFDDQGNFIEKAAEENVNFVSISGSFCRAPVYRKTPLGREITDVLVAVDRAYSKSDYIPCVIWGRNARFAGKHDIGSKTKINGRIQSRTYQKQLPDGTSEQRVAYEISVSSISFEEEVVENANTEQ